jgi:hypothetical protein
MSHQGGGRCRSPDRWPPGPPRRVADDPHRPTRSGHGCRAGSRQGFPVALPNRLERFVKAEHRAAQQLKRISVGVPRRPIGPHLDAGPGVIRHHQGLTACLHLAEQFKGMGLEVGFGNLPWRSAAGPRGGRGFHPARTMTVVIKQGQLAGTLPSTVQPGGGHDPRAGPAHHHPARGAGKRPGRTPCFRLVLRPPWVHPHWSSSRPRSPPMRCPLLARHAFTDP